MTNNILVSGLVNLETDCRVQGFPIEYAPIDFNFFGVNTLVSGVGFNIAKALTTLGSRVSLATLLGQDAAGDLAQSAIAALGTDPSLIQRTLRETPSSTVLYDGDGRRRIYCDLKDIQESSCNFDALDLSECRAVIACNINFNRPLLHKAKAAGIPIATDVHTLSAPDDDYNREFMECADILFLSDEQVPGQPREFLRRLGDAYGCGIIVLGQGGRGALMYVRDEDRFYDFTAASVGTTVNTVGAGDSLFSAFVCLWCEGLPPAECLRRAELFAAAKITQSGAANGFITRDELETLYNRLGHTIVEK